MAHQTTLKDGPACTGNGVFEGLEGLGNSLVTLATLQARLAAEDLRESARRVLPAMVAAAVLIPAACATVTLAMFGVAAWLAADRALSFGLAAMIVAAVGFVASSLLVVFALLKLRDGLGSFIRSREELERNIAWLRTVLVHSGR